MCDNNKSSQPAKWPVNFKVYIQNQKLPAKIIKPKMMSIPFQFEEIKNKGYKYSMR